MNNARSDFPRRTQYTDAHIALIKALTPTHHPFVSEEGIKCKECGVNRGHWPDIIFGPPGIKLAIYVDGSIHERSRQMRRDEIADLHIAKMKGFLPPYRVGNEMIEKNISQVVKEIIERVYGSPRELREYDEKRTLPR